MVRLMVPEQRLAGGSPQDDLIADKPPQILAELGRATAKTCFSPPFSIGIAIAFGCNWEFSICRKLTTAGSCPLRTGPFKVPCMFTQNLDVLLCLLAK